MAKNYVETIDRINKKQAMKRGEEFKPSKELVFLKEVQKRNEER